MSKLKHSLSARILCLLLSLVMIMTLIPTAVFTVEADEPKRQVWLYVPAGEYNSVEAAMSAMYGENGTYEEIAATTQNGVGVRVTTFTEAQVDTYPGFADSKLTNEIPSYDVGEMTYTFYGWQKMEDREGALAGSDEYATYGSTLALPAGTAVYAAVYLKRPRAYELTFRQADGTLIPELSVGLVYGADLQGARPTPTEEDAYVTALTGHTFSFWSDTAQDLSLPRDTAEDYFATHDAMGDSPVTLWAHYTPNTYTVTYEVKDPRTGEIVNSETRDVTYGQPLSYNAATNAADNMPAAPQMAGYTFTGWQDWSGQSYGAGSSVTFLNDMTLTAVFTPNDGQIYRARVWYETETGAYVDSGLLMDFTGVTHTEIKLSAYQREQLQALLPQPQAYVWHSEDSGVFVKPCTDPEAGDPSVINVYFSRRAYTLTIDGSGGLLEVNGTASDSGTVRLSVYAGTPMEIEDARITVKGADGVTYTVLVARQGYEYAWVGMPTVMPAADLTVSADGHRLNVPFKIELYLADLLIENEDGEIFTYTQKDLADLNAAYAEAYERAAERLTQALGTPVSSGDLRVSDLADETYKRYETIVNEELSKVDAGYSGRAVRITSAPTYTLYKTIEGMADAESRVLVDTVIRQGTRQYRVTYTAADGAQHTLYEDLLFWDGRELGFGAMSGDLSVTVASDGSTVLSLCYQRNTYGFTPSVFFGDGQNATEKFEGIPGISTLTTCYGAPLQALAQMYIDEAHEALILNHYGHEGYALDEFSSLYALHCKNTGALKDTYTWPAREYGLVIGEYVLCSYELTVHYMDAARQPLSLTLPVTYGTPLSFVLTAGLIEEMSVFGYDISGFVYTADGKDRVLPEDLMPAADTDIYVLYTPKTLALLFDVGAPDATPPIPAGEMTVRYHSPVGQLPETTRAGYIFDGWFYLDETGREVTVTADTVVDADMLSLADGRPLVLTARWKEGSTFMTVEFWYETLDGTYELDPEATLTQVEGTTGQTALEAILARDGTVFAAHTKAGFEETERDASTRLAGDGSTVYRVYYDRMTYHLTVYVNGVAAGDEGYAYGATLKGQGSKEKTATVSLLYGTALDTYMATLRPYAAGYTVEGWTTLTWDMLLTLSDGENQITAPVAYPLWRCVKARQTLDPTWGRIEVLVNGEAYGTLQYGYQNLYLPIGAEITLTAVAPENAENACFLAWINTEDHTVVTREATVTLEAGEAGVSYKAAYVYAETGRTYHVYANDRDGELLWLGYETFEALDEATRAAIVAEANDDEPLGEDERFTPEKGFTVIARSPKVIWYITNRS